MTPPAAVQFERCAVSREERPLLRLERKPGVLVDSNAPPPPPGQSPARHPFLTANCFGDVLLCSEAGERLRASSSWDDYLAKLRAAGFTVTCED